MRRKSSLRSIPASFLEKEQNHMSKKADRIVVTLRSTESGHVYVTEKNRRNNIARLELRKYDPIAKRRTLYRESR